jgi:peptidoglycan hydrolase CwlO-like protein
VLFFIVSIFQAKENTLLREEQVNVNELKNEVNKLHNVDKFAKQAQGKIAELEAIIAKLQAELVDEKAAKDALVNERDNIRTEKDGVSALINLMENFLIRILP